MCDLRPTQLQAATELFYANAQIQLELKYFQKAEKDYEAASSLNTQSERVENPCINDLASSSAYHNAVEVTSYLQRITRLFSIRRIRRSTMASSVCMIGQQLCGVYETLLVLLCEAGANASAGTC